jgi:hypothetical protein
MKNKKAKLKSSAGNNKILTSAPVENNKPGAKQRGLAK